MSNVLRNLPTVNELLESPPLRQLIDRASRNVVVTGVRHFLENLRQEVQSATAEIKVPAASELAERIADWITTESMANLRPVINATGVILHEGLGRAPLADAAVQALTNVAGNYASLEVDVATGQQSERMRDVERLLRKLTGAEAAVVVNNDAGATLLTLAALAAGREVLVSRGQVVESDGSYRLPEIMEASGVRLREVGTTNKTRIEDYGGAIRPETAALLRVHCSDYAIVGATQEVPLAALVELGRQHGLPVIENIGSGALVDLAAYGIRAELQATDSLKTGADVVLFSGDKLCGGPQCGLILGRKALLQKITAHPLMRAVQVDKLTLAALVATLQLHQDREIAERSLPVLALLNTPVANLQNRAERLAPQMAACPSIASAVALAGHTYLRGDALPGQELPTWCVALRPAHGGVNGLATALRTGMPSVFGRIHQDHLLLDLRTVFPRQDLQLVQAVQQLSGGTSTSVAEPSPESP